LDKPIRQIIAEPEDGGSGRFVLFAVFVLVRLMMSDMELAGLFAMVDGVQVMAMGQMGVVGGGLVIAALNMLGGVIVMLGGLRVGLRGLAMMLGDVIDMRHGCSSWRTECPREVRVVRTRCSLAADPVTAR
jgi:hypothetical protein